MHALRLDDIVMHYREDGDPSGRPVLFSNSLGTDLRVWDRVIARMPAGLRLIRYDTRGHGMTGVSGPPYSMERLADDAAALLDHLKVTGAVVVGLSIGGMTAQCLAARRPELVSAMVLMDTAARIGTPELWDERMRHGADGGVAALADAVMGRWFSREFRETQGDEMALWRAALVRTPLMGYLGCAAAIREADLTESTRKLRLPTLAMAGTEDGSTPPELVAATAALIPGSRMEIIPHAGHLPCIERPDHVAGLIVSFLEENGLV